MLFQIKSTNKRLKQYKITKKKADWHVNCFILSLKQPMINSILIHKDLSSLEENSLQFKIFRACNIAQVYLHLEKYKIDIILLDIDSFKESGFNFLKSLKQKIKNIPIFVISKDIQLPLVVDALKFGADDFLLKPLDSKILISRTDKWKALHKAVTESPVSLFRSKDSEKVDLMVAQSNAFKKLLKKVSKVKGHSINILIEGESGSGKEVLAKYIYALEDDFKRPFVAQNCATIPDNLFESELFGYEKGAFSGANTSKIGLIEAANGGDLFLDEINSLKYEFQAKLLRTIEEGSIRRVGSTKSIPVNFRLITASNFPLKELVKNGEFREDLYHRLSVAPFEIPPLRKRQDDISGLIKAFLREEDVDKRIEFSDEALQALKKYSWPGNVRELRNFIQNLIIFSENKYITYKELPSYIVEDVGKPDTSHNESNFKVEPLKTYMKRTEKEYIKKVLSLNNSHREETARQLGISRTAIYSKIRELEITT